jgi:hypothetical protein
MSRTRTEEPTVRLVLTTDSDGSAPDEAPSRLARRVLLVVGMLVGIALAVAVVAGSATRSTPTPTAVPTTDGRACVDVIHIAADAFATDPDGYGSQVDAIRFHTGRTRRDEVLSELSSEREFVSSRVGSDLTGASSADAAHLAALGAAIAGIESAPC